MNRDKCRACKQFERTCMAHLELFSKYPGRTQRSITVGLHSSYDELVTCARNGCHLCRCWVNALLAECSHQTLRRALISSSSPVTVSSPITVVSPLRNDVADAREAHFFEVCCSPVRATMRLGGVSKAEFKALMNSESLVDSVAWANERLRTCYEQHSLCSDLVVSNQLPTRLLSVSDPAVVHVVDSAYIEGSPRYVALSYCWGGEQEFTLTSARSAQLKHGVNPTCLSKTIQDAIVVCRLLNVDYLWVDALCIVQSPGEIGEGSDWNKEASAIQRTYGNAYATLSICSSDKASEGFLHEKHKSMSIDPSRSSLVGIEEESMLPVHVRKTLAHIRTETPLAHRGWIFQEELLSPRIIYYTEHGLFWSCSMLKDAQNGTAKDNRDALFPHLAVPSIMDAHEFRTSPDPLFLWDDMISTFSIRDFTVDDDRLPAVSGLAALIAQSTGEEYLVGLWKNRLPAQLLWIVSDPPRPSIEQSLSFTANSAKPRPPSWSWASVASGRRIAMPKQAVVRARFLKSVSLDSQTQLHLNGRTRMLTRGLSPLWSYPVEEHDGVVGPRYPGLAYQPNIWAVHQERCQVLVCLDWRRPIIIHLDNGVPAEDAFDDLVCFEVNYIGLLLLEPVCRDGEQVFRRIGCAQMHRESSFFNGAQEVNVIIE